jgi:geranylgeranyl pyrophosphate synthase
MNTLPLFASRNASRVERALRENLPLSTRPGTEALNGAIEHALFPAGKRMRPVLCLAGAALAGCEAGTALQLACALEYLHAASLAFDDLPAMDNSALRRGRESVHARFGEANAVLAGLALLNRAYALFGEAGPGVLAQACRAIGEEGMIAGQAIDLLGVARAREAHGEAYFLKTTALLRLAVSAGALACACPARQRAALEGFGYALGMAYQLLDDADDESFDRGRDGGPQASGEDLRGQARAWLSQARGTLVEAFGERLEARVLGEFAESLLGVHEVNPA